MKKIFIVILAICGIGFASCDDDNNEQTVPMICSE